MEWGSYQRQWLYELIHRCDGFQCLRDEVSSDCEHVGKLLKNEGNPLAAYPKIPWQAIYGLRNIISHEYANIDEEIIVSVINDDLAPLKSAIEELLNLY